MCNDVAPITNTFIGVMADTLEGSVARLQATVDHVTALVMIMQKPSRDMILAFQDFDRLKQEFDGLAKVLRHYAAAHPATGADDIAAGAIASITVSDLRDRIASGLSATPPALPGESEWEEEKVF